MNRIFLIVIGLITLYSATIVVPIYCMDSFLPKLSLCYWFYNHPVIFFIVLMALLIILNELVKLIRKRFRK